ncbi:hypothetical protein [Lacrimispora xylanisolvens]|uniref:hypothetical protein n=1 Tax=Lacrimispora xylanisolvens TaxID=384636 RepID=UPI0024027DF1
MEREQAYAQYITVDAMQGSSNQELPCIHVLLSADSANLRRGGKRRWELSE